MRTLLTLAVVLSFLTVAAAPLFNAVENVKAHNEQIASSVK
jgi:hypothetical protein